MKAYELLKDGGKWTQKAYARDKYNRSCSVFDKHAVSFCMIGAIEKCYGSEGNTSRSNTIDKNIDIIYIIQNVEIYLRDIKKIDGGVASYNDHHTYKEVVSLLKELDI